MPSGSAVPSSVNSTVMTHCVLRSESACHKSRQISFDFFWIITHVTPLQFGWGWQLGFCRCKMKKCGGGPLQNIKITNIGQIRPCILYNYKIQALNGGAAPKFVTCDPASFTFHICHLRLEKSITCDSSPFWIQTRKGMGWDVNAPSHLQKKALAHIHVEQGVGWGGMSTFPGTCKPRLVHIHVEQRVGRGGMLPFPGTCEARMAQKHWHIYTLNKGWGGVGCYPFLALARVGCCPSLAIRNPAEIKKSEKQQILAKPYKTVQTHSRRNVDQTFLVT